MKQLRYTLSFTTPAFMGNAEQNAQWRTPPIKALLRQWWRVAYAAEKGFALRVDEMRQEVGRLFGSAADGAGNKSLLRLRLNMPEGQSGEAWSRGTQTGVAPLDTGLGTGYAWFGLVNRGSGQADRNAIAIKPTESRRELAIAVPDEHAARIETTLQLIHHCGQLGSRSRGGWGSFALENTQPLQPKQLESFAQPLEHCLRHDWPMSLCQDSKGLCLWQSKSSYPSWDKAMRVIASERKIARTALKGLNGRDLRPVLGFATPGRMPSPLRWRVVPAPNKQLAIQVFAMPTQIPEAGKQRIDVAQVQRAWQSIIQTLDDSTAFSPRGAQQ